MTYTPADLITAIAKAAENFVTDASKPTENYIVRIKKVLTLILMKFKPYNKGNVGIHNMSGVVLNMSRYVEVFGVVQFVVPPVIPMYDETIPDNATITVVKRREMTHEGQRLDRALYEAGEKSSLAFIMKVVNRTWYATLEPLDTFFANVTALQLLEHLKDLCTVLYGIDAVEYPMAMKSFWKEAEGVPQYIIRMEALHKKSVNYPLPIKNYFMQAVAYKLLWVSGDYPDDMREWKKLMAAEQTWEAWKVKFMAAYSEMKILETVQELVDKPPGGTSPALPPYTHLRKPPPPTEKITKDMVDKLSRYLHSIELAATTAGGGEELAELAARLAIFTGKNATQARELKQMRKIINALKRKNTSKAEDQGGWSK